MYKGTDEQTYGGEESVVTTLDPDSNTQINANANATVRALGVNGALVLGVYEMSGGEYLEEKNSNNQTESEQREQMYRRRSDMVTPTLLRPGEGEEAAVVEAGENEGNNVNINDATVTKVVVANPAGEAPEGPGRAPPAPGSCTDTDPATCRRAEAKRRDRRWEETPIRTERQHSRDGGDHRGEHHHRHGPADNQNTQMTKMARIPMNGHYRGQVSPCERPPEARRL